MAEKLGSLPTLRDAESIAVGSKRVFIGSPSTTSVFDYKGDVFALPKTGGTPAIWLSDVGTQSRLLADGDELFVLGATSRSGSDDRFRLQKFAADGSGIELSNYDHNCTAIASDAADVYLACLGGASGGTYYSTVTRIPRSGGTGSKVADMNTVYTAALDAAYVYWVGSDKTGIQRRRKDLSAPVETLGPTDYTIPLDYQVDPVSSTAWWTLSGTVKRYRWKTKETSVFDSTACGLVVKEGAVVWRTCDSTGHPTRLNFMAVDGAKPTSWPSAAGEAFTLDADYIYTVQVRDVYRTKRPDR